MQKTGVLLVNLGTPAAPTTESVRSYLKEFLSDPRVVGLPRFIWLPILHGIVLRKRPTQSAAKYAKIWMQEGSPLKVYTERQSQRLQEQFSGPVAYAMSYGAPAISAQLDALCARGATRIVILPLYPQFADSTTRSVLDAVERWQQRTTQPAQIEFIRSFPDHPSYIAALAASVREHWQRHGQAEKLVMSFHGLPQRAVDRGDPYQKECFITGKLLAQALGLNSEQYLIAFQSRFGAAKWLQPYTQPTLEALGKRGTRSVDVICPGFVADCLETLEEIAMECQAAFLASGGKEFRYIPCLNEREDWIMALATIASV